MALTGQQIRDLGYNPDTVSSLPGGVFELSQFVGLGADERKLNEATDNYINSLLDQSKGDRDLAIKKITQEHDLAVGNDDQQTAQFLEKVASALETKIGRIPYDYKVATERTETAAKTALDRLFEDEKIWMRETDQSNKEARVGQQEQLLQRGILSGTREGAKGLAGEEVKTLEQKMQDKLEAYQRAKGRQVADIGTEKQTTLEDLQTGARRGVQDVQMSTSLGKESVNRSFDARAKELERQRALDKKANKSYALATYYGNV